MSSQVIFIFILLYKVLKFAINEMDGDFFFLRGLLVGAS